MYYLGIDPGLKGGYALISPALELIEVGELKNKTQYLFTVFNYCYNLADINLTVNIEKPFLAQQGNGTMYINYGKILAILELIDIPYNEITSQEWLKYHGLKKLDKKDKPSTRFIPELYPKQDFRRTERCKTIHDGFTDAVCIALYKK
jgi:hypothetical protein